MRGTLRVSVRRNVGYGIIPAYAGNTRSSCPRGSSIRDHPRICGEHHSPRSALMMSAGSSPHMRGTLDPDYSTVNVHGIIPAYAGNTYCRCLGSLRVRDHPRICGEHFPSQHLGGDVEGSSPHMRGTQPGSHGQAVRLGIIPAYAGNTPRAGTRNCPTRDHPRICGEHSLVLAIRLLWRGSSPHMRGTPKYG